MHGDLSAAHLDGHDDMWAFWHATMDADARRRNNLLHLLQEGPRGAAKGASLDVQRGLDPLVFGSAAREVDDGHLGIPIVLELDGLLLEGSHNIANAQPHGFCEVHNEGQRGPQRDQLFKNLASRNAYRDMINI